MALQSHAVYSPTPKVPLQLTSLLLFSLPYIFLLHQDGDRFLLSESKVTKNNHYKRRASQKSGTNSLKFISYLYFGKALSIFNFQVSNFNLSMPYLPRTFPVATPLLPRCYPVPTPYLLRTFRLTFPLPSPCHYLTIGLLSAYLNEL